MVSSISKQFILDSSFKYLKAAGFGDDQIEEFKIKIRPVVEANMKVNSFMG